MTAGRKIKGRLSQFGYAHKGMERQLLKWKKSMGEVQAMLEDAGKKKNRKKAIKR